MPTVVSVFHDEDQIKQAVDRLFDLKFPQDKLHIIDREGGGDMYEGRITPLAIKGWPAVGATNTSAQGTTPPVPAATQTTGMITDEQISAELDEKLDDLDVSEEERPFYVRTALEGGKLIIVTAKNKEHAAEARVALEKAGATRIS
jgi:hypothetical protein